MFPLVSTIIRSFTSNADDKSRTNTIFNIWYYRIKALFELICREIFSKTSSSGKLSSIKLVPEFVTKLMLLVAIFFNFWYQCFYFIYVRLPYAIIVYFYEYFSLVCEVLCRRSAHVRQFVIHISALVAISKCIFI